MRSTEVMLRHSDTRWKQSKAPLRSEAESWGWRWHAESEEWARKGVQIAKVRESQHNETKECATAQRNKHCWLGTVTMQRIQSNIHVVFFAVIKKQHFCFIAVFEKTVPVLRERCLHPSCQVLGSSLLCCQCGTATRSATKHTKVPTWRCPCHCVFWTAQSWNNSIWQAFHMLLFLPSKQWSQIIWWAPTKSLYKPGTTKAVFQHHNYGT